MSPEMRLRWAPRPHPNPLPQAGAGEGVCSLPFEPASIFQYPAASSAFSACARPSSISSRARQNS